jgi:NADH dehydrogenase FAD-containing subunit
MVADALKTEKRTRVLILGGGFGGFYTALHLDKTIASDSDIEVTLVSREDFVLFTPMLHEVAARDLELSDTTAEARSEAIRACPGKQSGWKHTDHRQC